MTKEEIANSITHGVGILCTIGAGIPLIWRAFDTNWRYAMGMIFFISCMGLMYSLSTAYHLTRPDGRAKRVMRIFDHISIYFMIAGSYTPICLGLIGGAIGWVVFGLLWGCVLAGIFYKSLAIDRYPQLSLFLYLLMGWAVIFIAKPVFLGLSPWGIVFILLEGAFYTGGAYFFAHDEEHAYWHAIWHVFVLMGTLAHCAVLWTLTSFD